MTEDYLAPKKSIESFEIKIPIAQNLLKSMPLPGIQSRNATAIILTFSGFRHDVLKIL